MRWLLGWSMLSFACSLHPSVRTPLRIDPTPLSAARAPHAVCRIPRPVEIEDDPEEKLKWKSMPPRWINVHDCDRPSRWRRYYDDEDCRVWLTFRGEKLDDNDEICDDDCAAEKVRVDRAKRKTPYTELVPNLVTINDFLRANQRANANGKILTVKFFSRKCRTCLRIAAQYRRLALDNSDSLDCYECEITDDARGLYERLEVEAVPSVQIFDGDGVTRLAKYTCKPATFKKVIAKVEVALLSMRKRRGLHRLYGTRLADDWILDDPADSFLGTS